jgi:tetratricopeptide (TPR) repeat protein
VDRAIQDFDAVIKADPGFMPAYLGRGEAHARAGRHERALEDYARYLRVAPDDAYARFRHGVSLSRLNQLQKSIAELGEAIRLDPRLLSAYLERGRALVRTGQAQQAVLDFTEAVGLAPRFAPAHNELAWLLATHPSQDVRDGRRAVQHARTAAELANWGNAAFLDTYAAALAEAGDFGEAVKVQSQAVQAFSGSARMQAEGRLRLYQEGRPFRSP